MTAIEHRDVAIADCDYQKARYYRLLEFRPAQESLSKNDTLPCMLNQISNNTILLL